MLKIKVFTGDEVEPESFVADFVSFISSESYGPPALVAPKDNRPPTAREGQTVVYINTTLVPLVQITRLGDDA